MSTFSVSVPACAEVIRIFPHVQQASTRVCLHFRRQRMHTYGCARASQCKDYAYACTVETCTCMGYCTIRVKAIQMLVCVSGPKTFPDLEVAAFRDRLCASFCESAFLVDHLALFCLCVLYCQFIISDFRVCSGWLSFGIRNFHVQRLSCSYFVYFQGFSCCQILQLVMFFIP